MPETPPPARHGPQEITGAPHPHPVPDELIDKGRAALVAFYREIPPHRLPGLGEQVYAVLAAVLDRHEAMVRDSAEIRDHGEQCGDVMPTTHDGRPKLCTRPQGHEVHQCVGNAWTTDFDAWQAEIERRVRQQIVNEMRTAAATGDYDARFGSHQNVLDLADVIEVYRGGPDAT